MTMMIMATMDMNLVSLLAPRLLLDSYLMFLNPFLMVSPGTYSPLARFSAFSIFSFMASLRSS